MTIRKTLLVLALAAVAFTAPAFAQEGEEAPAEAAAPNPVVVVNTNMGSFEITLFADKAPISVENFLQYVDDGHYNGTIFHRVIKGFMVQGGGFTPEMEQKETRAPIKNEAANGLKNTVGTVAMARTQAVDSATSQFFINTKDNDFLDHEVRDYGYAVFGEVTSGMDVVRKIENTPTGQKKGPGGYPMGDVPRKDVVIESIVRK